MLGGLEHGHSLLFGDRRKVIEKNPERISRHQVVEEDLHRYAGSTEHGRAAKDFRVTDDFFHWETLVRIGPGGEVYFV